MARSTAPARGLLNSTRAHVRPPSRELTVDVVARAPRAVETGRLRLKARVEIVAQRPLDALAAADDGEARRHARHSVGRGERHDEGDVHAHAVIAGLQRIDRSLDDDRDEE